ncbi:MAG: diphthine--ammonia ligase [Bacteroidetes bacterium]|nr:diphthine--ammonia ligase [Bacteroidota bacterium]
MAFIKSVFQWSGGKDSALGLWKLLEDGKYQVDRLLTTVNRSNNRISMHGVRAELVELQADSIGLPLRKLMLPEMPSMNIYEEEMNKTLTEFKKNGIRHAVFGDIFLVDLKEYRDRQLGTVGFTGVYPLWNLPSQQLIEDFIQLGFKAVVVCVNANFLDQSFLGRLIDHQFLKDLPVNVDPCGENGEFHTFVFEGPLFKKTVDFKLGERVYRDYQQEKNIDDTGVDTGFWYIDLLPIKK